MNVTAISYDGKRYNLGKPRTLKLSYSFDTPAHSLTATFLCKDLLPNFSEVQVTNNNNEIIFNGNVDEQIVSISRSGSVFTIDARSAAALLDNEAYPATYHNSSLQDIYRIHAKPYGIKGIYGDGILNGDFTIVKGMSEWEVICEFCKSVLDVQPQITLDGYIDARKNTSDQKTSAVISNSRPGAYRYFKATVKNKPYGVISHIAYKPEVKSSYKHGFKNPYLNNDSINVRRLVNLSDLQSYERKSKIAKVFKKSLAGSFEVTADVSTDFNVPIASAVNFYDEVCGSFEGILLYEKEYLINLSGEVCRIKLRPKEHF